MRNVALLIAAIILFSSSSSFHLVADVDPPDPAITICMDDFVSACDFEFGISRSCPPPTPQDHPGENGTIVTLHHCFGSGQEITTDRILVVGSVQNGQLGKRDFEKIGHLGVVVCGLTWECETFYDENDEPHCTPAPNSVNDLIVWNYRVSGADCEGK